MPEPLPPPANTLPCLFARMLAVGKEFKQAAATFRAQGNDEGECCMAAAAARIAEELESWMTDAGIPHPRRRLILCRLIG